MQCTPETVLPQVTVMLDFLARPQLPKLCVFSALSNISAVGGEYEGIVTFFQCWLWKRKLVEDDCHRAEKIIGCSSLLILSAAPATRDCITRC